MDVSDNQTTPSTGSPDAPLAEGEPRLTVGGKEAFSHEPRPRKTQPPASVTPDELIPEDYAESTNFTAKGGPRVADGGYRRSRQGAKKMKEDLRYGAYLEVPKGKQPIFSTQRSRVKTGVIIVAVLVAIAIVVFFCWMFFSGSMV